MFELVRDLKHKLERLFGSNFSLFTTTYDFAIALFYLLGLMR